MKNGVSMDWDFVLANNAKTTWDIFDDWEPSVNPPDWSVVDAFQAPYEAVITTHLDTYNALLDRWDDCLNVYGGDPTHRNWDTFRPLRLSREEDWSDWLAHLIFTSTTGCFSKCLFDGDEIGHSNFAKPKEVKREVASQGYRADLIVKWADDHYSCLEVKIGDESLRKTSATAEAIRKKHLVSVNRWSNFILLLSHQKESWNEIHISENANRGITVLTWDDVCVALRKALFCDEEIEWKVWAYTFLGAIEQKLIGFVGYDGSSRISPATLIQKNTILLRSLDNGK